MHPHPFLSVVELDVIERISGLTVVSVLPCCSAVLMHRASHSLIFTTLRCRLGVKALYLLAPHAVAADGAECVLARLAVHGVAPSLVVLAWDEACGTKLREVGIQQLQTSVVCNFLERPLVVLDRHFPLSLLRGVCNTSSRKGLVECSRNEGTVGDLEGTPAGRVLHADGNGLHV